MILDVLHTAFTVSDIDRSVRWYTEVLGLELVHRRRGESDYIRTLVGEPDAVLEIAMLSIPGLAGRISSHVLELIQYVEPVGSAIELRNVNVGVAHLAFIVDDVLDRHERLTRLGVQFYSPPVRIAEGANAGGFTCYLRDPDGITLEFLQPSAERLRALRDD